MAEFSPSPNTTNFVQIELAEAERFFKSHSSDQDRAIFISGCIDQCDRAFGLHLNRRLIGIATLRDAQTYWENLPKMLTSIDSEKLLPSLLRIGIYQPQALQQAPREALAPLFKQIAWIALGGKRGWQGAPFGTELFCRFIEPRFRAQGYGLKLLDNLLLTLELEGKLPLRALPSSKEDRSYAGRGSAGKLVVLNHEYFMERLSTR